jgi:carbon-monoxide dehydrogenase small subunit
MPLLRFEVNGRPVETQAPPHTLLVDLLRGPLALTGTHVGCDTAQCGACTVLLDGRAVKSCNILAVQAQGGSITTVEGLAPAGGPPHPLQEAFMATHGLQCGFCTPGMLMTAADLLASNANPTEAEIVHALEGNLCRCTGYVNIVAAIRQAAQAMSAQRGAAA